MTNPSLLDRTRFTYLTIIAVGTLYIPQPNLPRIAENLALSSSNAALLTTTAFLPLIAMPLFFGFILEIVNVRVILHASLLSLLLTNILIFIFSDSFQTILVLRFFQGVAVSGILISVTTYLSKNAKPENLSSLLSLYVASTIFGGFVGRVLSAVIAMLISWPYTFLFGAINAFICIIMIGRTHININELLPNAEMPALRTIYALLLDKNIAGVLIIIFCCFFSFSSIVNFFPFYLTRLHPGLPEIEIGFIYTGYLVGAGTALFSSRFIRLIGSLRNAVIFGMILLSISIVGWFTTAILAIFMSMILTCASMFLIQSILTGHVNSYFRNLKAVANGIYIAAYYTGGAAGSFFPGLVYDRYGWSGLLIMDLLILAIGMLSAGLLK
ncbi:MFS transporter [Acidithiobacillus ferrianus]|uniref:MFS transporter n=1 Tax=Acidithiobacillus ferrianus TaxID=2678518 RepID=UPI0034E56727